MSTYCSLIYLGDISLDLFLFSTSHRWHLFVDFDVLLPDKRAYVLLTIQPTHQKLAWARLNLGVFSLSNILSFIFCVSVFVY